MPLHYLTDEDCRVLQWLIDREHGESTNRTPRSDNHFQDGSSNPAPETYIAKPESDISGIDDSEDPPIVSSGLCRIYRLDPDGSNWELIDMEGPLKTVFNYTPSGLSDEVYYPVIRTKSGQWISA